MSVLPKKPITIKKEKKRTNLSQHLKKQKLLLVNHILAICLKMSCIQYIGLNIN